MTLITVFQSVSIYIHVLGSHRIYWRVLWCWLFSSNRYFPIHQVFKCVPHRTAFCHVNDQTSRMLISPTFKCYQI